MFILVHRAPRCAVRQNLCAVSSRLKAQRPQAWPLWKFWNLEHIDLSEKKQTYYEHLWKLLINIEMGWVRTSQWDAGGLQFEDIWGYEWIAVSLTLFTIPHSNLQINLNSTKKNLKADQSDGRCVPRWRCPKTSQDDPRCPTGLFFQGCLLALFYSYE